MFGYMEIFYIRASFGRLLLTKVKFTRLVKKILGEKFVISKILHLSLQRDFKVITFKHKFNAQIERKMIKVSTNNNKNGLAYSSKDINRNFRIKVSGVDAQGRKVHKLVGVAGAIALIGVEMLNKLLKRAFACMDDVCVCKLRRGIKFSFYYK